MNFVLSISFGDILTIISLISGICTYYQTHQREKQQATLEAFNRIQDEVLDKIALVDYKNAELIIENLDNPKFKEAYDGYRVLIARLEHFAIGVNTRIYDIDIVNKLAGVHLIFLYRKVKPIIEKANERANGIQCYGAFTRLVDDLKVKHPEIH